MTRKKPTPEEQRDREDVNWALHIYTRLTMAAREPIRRELRAAERQWFSEAPVATEEEVFAALHALDGQRINERLLDHLPGGRVEWRLRTELGAIELQNRDYHRTSEGVCLLLLAPGQVPVLDVAWVERQHRLRTEPRR